MDTPKANKILSDPRYIEGKRLILSALKEHKESVDFVKLRSTDYFKDIALMEHLRGFPLFYPYIGSGLGNGLLVELADGSVKYDLISGIGVHFFGHSHEKIISHAIDAAIQDTVMQGNLQQNNDSLKLMQHLKQASKMDHVFLSTSGAMANENALKIIFQKKHPAFRIIAFDGCFMGRTTTLSQITDKPSFRENLPSNLFVDYIPFYDPKDPIGSTHATLKELKKHLSRHPKEYAVLCIEPVQGEKGFYVGAEEFFKKVVAVAKEAGLAIFVDEVQTFARTYELFAFHYFDIPDVDVVSIGKVAQVAATFWKESFNPRPGLLSQTFTASTSAIHASLFTIDYLTHSHLYGPNGKMKALFDGFCHRLNQLGSLVHGPFGIGSMIAFTPFNGSKELTAKFIHRLFENGVIAFVAGSDPVRVRFLLPAPIMSEEDIDPIMDIVEMTLHEVNE